MGHAHLTFEAPNELNGYFLVYCTLVSVTELGDGHNFQNSLQSGSHEGFSCGKWCLVNKMSDAPCQRPRSGPFLSKL